MAHESYPAVGQLACFWQRRSYSTWGLEASSLKDVRRVQGPKATEPRDISTISIGLEAQG